MNQHQSLGLVAVIAVVAGLTGVTALGDISFVENDISSTSASIMGHVIIQVTDDEGNIKAYMQTDNQITADAKRCTGELLFGYTPTLGCVSSLTAFDDIELSSATFGETGTTANLLNAGFTPKLAGTLAKFLTSTVSEGVSATGVVTARVDIVHTFQYTGGGQSVASAALMNTANSVFAIQNFPSAVSLNNGDDLTVTWQIELG